MLVHPITRYFHASIIGKRDASGIFLSRQAVPVRAEVDSCQGPCCEQQQVGDLHEVEHRHMVRLVPNHHSPVLLHKHCERNHYGRQAPQRPRQPPFLLHAGTGTSEWHLNLSVSATAPA